MKKNLVSVMLSLSVAMLAFVIPSSLAYAQTTPTIVSVTGCLPADANNCKPNTIYPGGLVIINMAGMVASDLSDLRVDFIGDRVGVSPSGTPSLSQARVIAPNNLTPGSNIQIRLIGGPGFPESNSYPTSVSAPGSGGTGGSTNEPTITKVNGCKYADNGNPCTPGVVGVGDESIVIVGTNLTPVTKVTINGQPASVRVSSATQLGLNLPSAATTGTMTISVTTSAGQTSKTFTVGSANAGSGTGETTGGGTTTGTGAGSVSSDLKAECEKQALEYDTLTGLCLPKNPYANAPGDSLVKATSVGDLIKKILNILLTLGGVVAVLFIVLGGYEYITSRGSEERAKSGRKTMTYAIIGLVAILLAFMMVTVLTNLFTQGKLFS